MNSKLVIEKIKQNKFGVALVSLSLALIGQLLLTNHHETLAVIFYIIAIGVIFYAIGESKNSEFRVARRTVDVVFSKDYAVIGVSILFAIVSFILFSTNHSNLAAWIFHLLSVLFLIIGSYLITKNKYVPARTFFNWGNWEIISFFLILISAAIVRIVRLEQIPFGFWYDEATNGLNAINILHEPGYLPILFGDANLPAHFNYLIALSMRIFGFSVFSVRFVSAFFGIATVAAAFFTGTELFNRKVGLFLAFFLAFSRWDINWSRIGMHGVAVPFFELLAVGLIFKALRTQKLILYAFTGLALGFGFLFYFPLRFFPILIVLILLFIFQMQRDFFRQNYVALLLVILAAIIAVLPFFQYSVEHPGEFFSRMQNTSIFSPNSGEQSWQAVIETAKEHLLMFNYQGDRNGRHNLSGMPMLDPVSGSLMVLGLAICIKNFNKTKYFLIVSWFILMLLPGIFSLNFESPQSYRSIGSLPAAYLLAVVPLYYLSELWQQSNSALKNLFYRIFMFLLIGIVIVTNLSIYFNYQQNSTSSWLEFSAKDTIIGNEMAKLSQDADFYVSSLYFGTPTIQFLAPNVKNAKALETYDSFPMKFDHTRDAVIYLDASQTNLFDQLKDFYPHGDYQKIREPNGMIVLYEIRLRPQDIEENQGLTANYYSNTDFSGQPVFVREEKDFDRIWTDGDPLPFPFGMEWNGSLYAHSFGKYQFAINSAIDSEIYIDDQKVNLFTNDPQESGVILAKGLHKIKIRTQIEGGTFRLEWMPPGEEMQPLSSESLFNTSVKIHGLYGQYFSNPEWSGEAAYAQIDPYIDFYFHNQPLKRPYTVEWTGEILISEEGEYKFGLESVDESMLYIDDLLVIDDSIPQDRVVGTRALEKGFHSIRVRYSDHTGYTHIHLYWTPPGKEEEIIPPQVFSPPPGK